MGTLANYPIQLPLRMHYTTRSPRHKCVVYIKKKGGNLIFQNLHTMFLRLFRFHLLDYCNVHMVFFCQVCFFYLHNYDCDPGHKSASRPESSNA